MKTTKEFIERAKKVHGDKYDYSKTEYKGYNTKVCIICPEHGEFWQLPYNHLQNHGCPTCKFEKIRKIHTPNIEEFIKKARKVHGDQYDYSKVNYINNNTKVCIICPEHGEFWRTPVNHLKKGIGCSECRLEKLKDIKLYNNTKKFIEKAKKVYGDKYNYSKVNYINKDTKVCIICSEHGEFWQSPEDHLKVEGCLECRKENMRKKRETEFIDKAKKIYNNKYDYSKVNYLGYNTKVCIVCPEHGEFWQTPEHHLKEGICPECRKDIYKTVRSSRFIERAKKVHGDKYDYSKVNYLGYNTKVCIICPEHGEFWQTPTKHLQGLGCNHECKSFKLESLVKDYFDNNKIFYKEQKTWDWLIYKGKQRVDFYLPDYNIAIECQGIQHFEEVPAFKSANLSIRQEKDKNKKQLCNDHEIKILYFSNLSTKNNKYNYPYEVFENLDLLLEEIKKYKKYDRN